MKLIRELYEEVEYITETAEDGKKNLYVEGIFMQSGIKNRNGRIYPESVMDNEVNRYISEKVNHKSSYGELEHPTRPTVSLKEASHLITSLTKEGKNWVGKAKIMDTPNGNIARGIMESGGRLGISSRGLGTLKKLPNGINEVQSDFRLMTAGDLVSDPSGPNCWVEGLIENVEWFYDPTLGDYAQKIIETVKQEVKKNKIDENRKLQLFKMFLESVSK